MTGCFLEPCLSGEEADQLDRSVKKHERNESDNAQQESVQEIEPEMENELPAAGAWNGRSFVEAIWSTTPECEIYTGEEEDSLDDLGLTDVIHPHEHPNDSTVCFVVDIPWEESWVPWRWALILKTLGRNVSYKLIAPKIKHLWQLTNDCKIIDID